MADKDVGHNAFVTWPHCSMVFGRCKLRPSIHSVAAVLYLQPQVSPGIIDRRWGKSIVTSVGELENGDDGCVEILGRLDYNNA